MPRKPRKPLTFSGPETTDLRAPHERLATAAAIRVTRHGYLIHAVDRSEDVLAPETPKQVDICDQEPVAIVSDARELQRLVDALQVTELTDFICMCSGDLAFEFVDADGRCVDVVRADLPDTIEWRLWPGKALLANPDALRAWLRDHKVA